MPPPLLKTKNDYEYVKELPSFDLSSYLFGVFVIMLDVDDGVRQEPDEGLAAGLHLRRGLRGLEGGLEGGLAGGAGVMWRAGIPLLDQVDVIILLQRCS